MIGTLLAGHQITAKIKDGSVGTVWKALNRNGQVVALKQLSAKNAAVSSKRTQFKNEALLTRRLQHRNIIRVHDYVDMDPQPFFTMEYFESENLKYALWYQPDKILKQEFAILLQIAEALAHVHAQGVVHRDMKPENVLVSASHEVRLIDLSLAQTSWDRLLPWKRKSEGTPLYMAPEQIRAQKCDARTDVYAFGATMFELLTKRPPFIATTEAGVLKKHLTAAVPSLRTIVPTASPDLDAFVQKMLAKKPEDRFPDMTTIIVELSRWDNKDTKIRLRQVEPSAKTPAGPPAPGA